MLSMPPRHLECGYGAKAMPHEMYGRDAFDFEDGDHVLREFRDRVPLIRQGRTCAVPTRIRRDYTGFRGQKRPLGHECRTTPASRSWRTTMTAAASSSTAKEMPGS